LPLTEIAADRSIRSFRITAGRAFAWLLLLSLFVVPCVAGPASAYLALLAAVFGAVFVGSRASLSAATADAGLWLFPIAFLLLVIAFSITARTPDELLAILDFGALVLVIPAFMLLVRFASPRNALLVAWLALGGSAGAVVMGLYEGFALGAERASGNSSPIFFSDLGLWLGFVALAGFFVPHARWRYLFALGPIFGTAAALMGGTRGAVLVAAALIVVFVVFVIAASIGRRWVTLGAAAIVLLISAGVAAVFFDTDRMLEIPELLQEMVAGGETTDASVNYRLEFYRGGLQAIGEAPIAGHGWWHRFEAAAAHMEPEAARQGMGNRSAHLHNDALNFGAGAGALGIAAYLLLLAAPLAGAWFSASDSQRTARLYLASVLSLGFLAMGLTDSMFVYELPKTVFCMTAAVILGFCRDGSPLAVPLITERLRTMVLPMREVPAWIILVFILVLPGLVGSLSSAVVLVTALLCAVPALSRPGALEDLRWQPAMTIFVAAFAMLTAIFIITANEPDDVRFALNFIALLLAPAVFLMAREKPADDARLLTTLALAGTGAAAVLAVLVTVVLHEPRASGLFGGPNLFPRVAIPLGFIAMGGALIVPGRWRWVFYLGPLFALVVAVLAASRGAALALVPLALIAGIALFVRRATRRDVLGLVAIVLVVGAVVSVIAPAESARLLTTISSIGDVIAGDASADFATHERQAMLSAGWTAFMSAPWIGYGWADLGTAAAVAYPEGFGQLAGAVFMFHNDPLDFAVAGGVFGIAVYLLLLAAPIVGAFAAPRDELRAFRFYGALVLSVSFVVFGLTDMTFGYDLTTTLYAFATALLLGVRTTARP
jgi:O-antigen ligase